MPTAAVLIESAARAARVIPEEQTMPGYIGQRGLEIFNDILGEFGGSHVTIPNQSIIDVPLVVGQEIYTSGNGAQYDIDDNQIIDIMDAWVTMNQVRYPLVEINEKMYRNICYPQSQGIPAMYHLREFNVFSQIILQPIPSQVFTMTLVCKQRLSQVSLTTDLSQIPAQWLLGLKFLIARDFIYYYALPQDPNFMNRVTEVYNNLMAENNVDVTVEKTEIITRNRFYYPYILGFF